MKSDVWEDSKSFCLKKRLEREVSGGGGVT